MPTLAAVLLSGCNRSRTYELEQEALYAAEIGLEVGKRYVADACKSNEGISGLHKLATNRETPVPGYEQPTSVIYGQRIRGAVTVRLRAVEHQPTAWLVVSTGDMSGTKRVVEGRVSCPVAEQAEAH